MKRFLNILLFILTFFIAHPLTGQTLLSRTPDVTEMEQWVEAWMSQLTPEERLSQLVFPLYILPNGTEAELSRATKDLAQERFGGILLSKGTMASHLKAVNRLQETAREELLPPLLIAIDGEWGLQMRLNDAIRYPRNGALGRIHPTIRDTVCYLYGREVARQCRELGIHINFAPVLDVNSNPRNPVIGTRSFGSDPALVAAAATAYAHGLEDGGVLSVGKHFPGHGDTETDSHKTLPVLRHSLTRLHEVELAPFGAYIDQGLGGIMTAHLDIENLTGMSGMPASASPRVVTDLLQKEMNFKGLVFTDGLAMQGAMQYPDIAVRTLLAGNDIILQPTPQAKQLRTMREAMAHGYYKGGYQVSAKEFQQLVDEKCRKVLRWKYALGLSQKQKFVVTGIKERVNTPYAYRLRDELNRLVGSPDRDDYDPTLQNQLPEGASWQTSSRPSADTIATAEPTQPAVSPDDVEGSLDRLRPSEDKRPVWMTPADTLYIPEVQERFTPARNTGGLLTLPTADPATVGMDATRLAEVTRLAREVVSSGASPGCQVLIARKGMVVYNRAFGKQGGSEYQNKYANQAITPTTRYDLASVSKAVGIVPALMLVMAEYDIKLTDYVARYVSELNGTPYATATVQDFLFHESGLQSVFSFYNLIDKPNAQFRDKQMIAEIASLVPRRRRGQMLYSCLNFVVLRNLVERVSHQRLDKYLEQRLPGIYGKNGLCYNPLEHGISLADIAPTEQDNDVRGAFIHGTVHDEIGAWALGVEGNSGLFASAERLAPLLQLFLNHGSLDGKQYLPASLCRTFTTTKSTHSRRGLGFDKPDPNPSSTPNCALECSLQTFGHTGFTGTCFWVDPQEELIYIFLSNRVCPTRRNKILIRDEYRQRIQSAIYRSIHPELKAPVRQVMPAKNAVKKATPAHKGNKRAVATKKKSTARKR